MSRNQEREDSQVDGADAAWERKEWDALLKLDPAVAELMEKLDEVTP